ncbi:hypothetical protein GBZ26_16355 [Azospirillum formosense]|uniref:Uncharacterized protein n=1 Tax=Azospirillum formosense TaxID=861533 RepID=A0ABX2KW17_9PROT|nr:hypothetical protein [Azospirillum formosense]MBY3756035.1 hypothetical protein [Azospirillum formosense]NUB20766.1 hypothetical protein [Azospirillum formosense]
MSWAETVPLACFAAALLAGSAAAVQLAGFFPAAHRPAALTGIGGGALVLLLAGSVVMLLVAALWLAVARLPWPPAVIAAGVAVLFGPLLFQSVPAPLRDGCAGAALSAVLNLVLAVVLAAHIPG